jgi:biofilm PGA synthesis lipoprotein PgaB
LVDFTQQIADRARRWSPELATARNLFAEPVLHPEAETWFAQSLPAFLGSYNLTALMAMPSMENVSKERPWLKHLARVVEATPHGTERTLFELQTLDWRTNRAIPTSLLAKQMRELQDAGILHLGYYPDDFAKGNPDIDQLSSVFSSEIYAAQERKTK